MGYSPEGRLFVHPAAAGLRPDRLDAVVDERALHPRGHHLLRHRPERTTKTLLCDKRFISLTAPGDESGLNSGSGTIMNAVLEMS